MSTATPLGEISLANRGRPAAGHYDDAQESEQADNREIHAQD